MLKVSSLKRWFAAGFLAWGFTLFLGVCPYLCPGVQASDAVSPCHSEEAAPTSGPKDSHPCCLGAHEGYLPALTDGKSFFEMQKGPILHLSDSLLTLVSFHREEVYATNTSPPRVTPFSSKTTLLL